jgi:hypothetical protein
MLAWHTRECRMDTSNEMEVVGAMRPLQRLMPHRRIWRAGLGWTPCNPV